MKRATKNSNKENLFSIADRFNSRGKSARDELLLKQHQNKNMERKRGSLISLKLQQNELPILSTKINEDKINKIRVNTEGFSKRTAILDSITSILKFKETKTIDLQIQKLEDLRNKNKVLRKDLLTLENVMLKYSLKNIKAN